MDFTHWVNDTTPYIAQYFYMYQLLTRKQHFEFDGFRSYS